MEKTGSKTIMCSVLFLDIVEYSRKSVAGQISLKERFAGYLSAAISSVPIADRIILDTGDGAAINFIGDIEDALRAVLSLRESLLNEDPNVDPPLRLRMGINLGPVRMVMDINGQPNVVGDGINVAQRIMGFAEPGQILVSRSYCDAVSRLSPQYAGLFHFMGSRTDKHVREHEVYVVGRPGEKTTELAAAAMLSQEEAKPSVPIVAAISTAWNAAASHLDDAIGILALRFRQAAPKQRILYAGTLAVAILLIGVMLFKLIGSGGVSALPNAENAAAEVAAGAQPGSAAVDTSTMQPAPDASAGAEKASALKAGSKNAAAPKPAQPRPTKAVPADSGAAIAEKRSSARTSVVVICKNDEARVFVDYVQKGKVSRGVMNLPVSPGRHLVVVKHDSGFVHQQKINLEPGASVRISPKFCD